jgi:hypothetical protein
MIAVHFLAFVVVTAPAASNPDAARSRELARNFTQSKAAVESENNPSVLRKPIAIFAPGKQESGANAIHAAALSLNGKNVAVVHGGRLTVYAIGQDKELFTTKPGEVQERSLAFSSDGQRVAYIGKGSQIWVVSSETGNQVSVIDDIHQNDGTIDIMTFSPDGKRLAVSFGHLYHKYLRVYDVAAAKRLGEPLNNVDGMAKQLLFSADGERLVANHWFTIYLIDSELRLAAKVKAESPAVFFDGGKLYCVDNKSTIVHEIGSKGLLQVNNGPFAGKKLGLTAMWMQIAGKPPVAAIINGKNVLIRSLAGKEIHRVETNEWPLARVALSADAHMLLVCCQDGSAAVFRLE